MIVAGRQEVYEENGTEPGIPIDVRPARDIPERTPGRLAAWKRACVPILAVLAAAAIVIELYAIAAMAGPAVLQLRGPEEPEAAESGPAWQVPPVPERPDAAHEGQGWALLCDGTVAYEGYWRYASDLWPDRVAKGSRDDIIVFPCLGGEGNAVGDIMLEYADHYGHASRGGDGMRTIRYGAGTTVGEFLSGTGFAGLDGIAENWDEPGGLADGDPEEPPEGMRKAFGAMRPAVYMREEAPDAAGPGNLLSAHAAGFGIRTDCPECRGTPGILVDGAPLYDLEAVIGVLGLPACAGTPSMVEGHFADPESSGAAGGWFDVYIWDLGDAGYLYIDFGRETFMVMCELGLAWAFVS